MSVLLDTMFLRQIVRIRCCERVDTAICLEKSGVRFLVTAAHLMWGAQAGDRFAVRHESDWSFFEVARLEFADNDVDACVVVPRRPLGNGLPVDRFNAVTLGEAVAFCGFPLGLEMEGIPDARGWPTALVKAGIFSGAVRQGSETVYLFDAANNVGFSGGPVIRRKAEDGKLYIVGIVSGYKYDAPQPVMEKTADGKTSAGRDDVLHLVARQRAQDLSGVHRVRVARFDAARRRRAGIPGARSA